MRPYLFSHIKISIRAQLAWASPKSNKPIFCCSVAGTEAVAVNTTDRTSCKYWPPERSTVLWYSNSGIGWDYDQLEAAGHPIVQLLGQPVTSIQLSNYWANQSEVWKTILQSPYLAKYFEIFWIEIPQHLTLNMLPTLLEWTSQWKDKVQFSWARNIKK